MTTGYKNIQMKSNLNSWPGNVFYNWMSKILKAEYNKIYFLRVTSILSDLFNLVTYKSIVQILEM